MANKQFEDINDKYKRIRKNLYHAEEKDLNELDNLIESIANSIKDDQVNASDILFKKAVEEARDGIAFVRNSEMIFANKKLGELLGYSPDEKFSPDFLHYIPENLKGKIESLYKNRVSGESVPSKYETLLKKKDGSNLEVEVNSSIINFEGDSVVITIIRDISNRKNTERNLKYRVELEKLLSSIATRLLEIDDSPTSDIFYNILNDVSEFSGIDRSYIFLVDDDFFESRNTYEYCGDGIPSQLEALQNVPLNTIQLLMNRLQENDFLYVDNIKNLDSDVGIEYQLMLAKKCTSMLILPLIYSGIIIGFLGFDSVKTEKYWGKDDISILMTLANIIVGAIQRKKILTNLVDEENRLKMLLDSTSDGVWYRDLISNKVYYSKNWFKILGYDESELPEAFETFESLIHPDDKEYVKDNITNHLEGRSAKYRSEFRMRTKSGSWKWILSRGKVTEYNEFGIPLKFMGTHEDISLEKEASKLIHESDERYKTIFMEAPNGIFQSTFDGKLIDLNDSLAHMLGYEDRLEALENISDLATQVYSDPTVRQKIVEKAHPSENLEKFVVKLKRLNGELFDAVLIIKALRKDEHSEEYFLGHIEDITSRLQSESALKESEEKFRGLIEQSTDGIYLIGSEGLIIEWNKGMEEITGISRQNAIGKISWEVLMKIQPPDRQSIMNISHLKRSIESAIKSGSGDYINRLIEIDIVFPNGTDKVIQEMNFPIRIEDKYLLAGIVRDITERKLTEGALIRSEERYRLIADNATDLITRLNIDAEMLYVSPSSKNLLGYHWEELINTKYQDLIHPSDKKDFNRKLIIIDSPDMQFEMTYRIRRYDGIYRWFQTSGKSLLKDDNDIEILFVSRDITDTKKTQDLLTESEEKYRQLFDIESDCIALIDANSFEIIEINKSGIELFKFEREEFLKLSILDISSDPESMIEYLSTAKKSSFFIYGIRKDGELLPLEISSSFFIWKGREVIVVTLRNITERVRSEQELEKQRSFLGKVINANPNLIYVKNSNDELILVNTAFAGLLNTLPESLVQEINLEETEKIILESIFSEDYRIIIGETNMINREEFVTDRWGNQLWFNTVKIPMYNEFDEIEFIISVSSDTTSRKITENALRASKERYQLMANNATDMISRHSPEGYYLYVSPSTYDLLGYNTEDIIGSNFYDLIHPEDKDSARQSIVEILESNEVVTISYRYMKSDGEYIWFETSCKTIIDSESNSPLEIISVSRDITSRKEAEKALRESEERYRRIVETANEGIWVLDNNHITTFVNEITSNLLNVPIEDIVGTSPFDYMNEKWKDRALSTWLNTNLSQSMPTDFKFTRTDNRDIWVMLSAAHIKDEKGGYEGALIMLNDITQRKQAEDLLLSQKESFETLANSSMTLLSSDNYHQGISDSIELIGKSSGVQGLLLYENYYNSDEDKLHMDRNFEWLDSKSNIPPILNQIEKILYTKSLSYYDKLIHGKDEMWDIVIESDAPVLFGSSNNLVFNTYVSPLMIRGKYWGFLAVITANNYFKWTEEQLIFFKTVAFNLGSAIEQKITSDNLKMAKEAAETANKAKSEFLANMSHEIRTPLTSVIGFSELLLNSSNDSKQKKFLNTILTSSNSLLALINDILDLSKIEAGKFELQIRPVNLRKLLFEVSQIFSQKTEDKNIKLIQEVNPQLPEALFLDEIRLRQILFNLVGNSVKFTDKGFIKIIVDQINSSESRIDLEIKVVDTGIGIAADQQDWIFEAFSQQSGQSNRKYGGTGLGLAITKRLTEKMNGEIELISDTGKGCTFKILIRDVGIAEDFYPDDEKPVESNERIEFDNLNLLIIDDYEFNIELIKNYLEGMNLRIIEASNFQEATKILNSESIHIVLTDLKLPDIDGKTAAKVIKNEMGFNELPVIAFTTSAIPNETDDVRLFDGILLKPVNKSSLIEKLVNLLPHKKFKRTISNHKKASQLNNKDIIKLLKLADFNNLKLFYDIICEKFIPKLSEYMDFIVIDDVECFATDLLEVSDNYHIELGKLYAEELYETIQNYNVGKIRILLGNFNNIYDIIRNFISNNEQ